MLQPLVSVLIPARNVDPFIDASVGSALSQSDVALEVIVVNDGSSDETSSRLKAWNDLRLQVITQPHQGLASSLNTAIRASRGTYVAFLDADDMWLPGKLAAHIQFHQDHPDIDATFSWTRTVDHLGQPVRMPCPRWRGAISYPQLLADFVIRTMSAVVMRRAAAEQAGWFDSNLVRCVDFEFLLRVALLRPNNIHAVPEVLNLYRRHGKQRTRDWRLMRDGWNQMLASLRRHAPRETAAAELPAAVNIHRYLAALAYEAGDFGSAFQLAKQTLALSPTMFLRDTRNWKMGAAVAAGLTLPKRALLVIEKIAGFERSLDE
jgi:glycosyltransferase involved in cell wall biosynthesis